MPATTDLARKFSGGREGLRVTVEERAAEVLSLTRELEGYEQRAASARIDKDDEKAAKWDNRAEQVRDQLRHRGEAPHQRATKRRAAGQETRA